MSLNNCDFGCFLAFGGKDGLSELEAFGFDETASKRGHNYVTVFVDMKLKGSGLTEKQVQALDELKNGDFCTTIAWRIKEKLRWIRGANTPRAALWRITNFLNHARSMLTDAPELEAIRNAMKTLENHRKRILQRWTSTYTFARMEGLNSLFQAARARARGYRNDQTFITMIYMIAAPIRFIFKST